jgi:methylmalonyl-CoA mutase N-terminal domain/subunit
VAIDSIDDMRVLFDGLPLDKVSHVDDDQRARPRRCCCSTSSSPRSRASRPTSSPGTIQNDVLKEYIARGTYIYPPKESLRLIADIFAYCQAEMPRWNTISISGYHMAEAGATPAQEIAFTLANAKEYVRAAQKAGLDVDTSRPGCPSSSWPARRCWRRSRSSARPGGSGPRS